MSVRTVYRDIEALHAAGVPLYGDAGHAGGYQLLAGYRTRLTGLSAGEAEALFLSGHPGTRRRARPRLGPRGRPAQAARGAPARTARRRPTGCAPASTSTRPAGTRRTTTFRHLPRVADAVWHSRVLDVRYRRWKEPTDVDRRLEPYGLVLKAGRWYVVAGPGTAYVPGRPDPRTRRTGRGVRASRRTSTWPRTGGATRRTSTPGCTAGEALVRLAPRTPRPASPERPAGPSPTPEPPSRTAGSARCSPSSPSTTPTGSSSPWARTSRSSSPRSCGPASPRLSARWQRGTRAPDPALERSLPRMITGECGGLRRVRSPADRRRSERR